MILVAGPSCGGKTTYVQQRALPQDNVLDYGDILEELGQDRYAVDEVAKAQARTIWQSRLPTSDWVIWSAASRTDRGRFRTQYGAQVFVVMAPLPVCLERAQRERPQGWDKVVLEWFAAYTPSRSGKEEVVWTG